MLAAPDLLQAHVDEIVAAAVSSQASGVQIDYRLVDAKQRDNFSSFVSTLSQALAVKRLALVVSVPTPSATDTGAYDWLALTRSAKLWLFGPDDLASYYEQVEAALTARRGEGVDLTTVSLVVDRASRDRSRQAVSPLTLQDALVLASALRAQPASGVTPGQAVTLSAVNLDEGAGNAGLRWDAVARAVSFAYSDRLGPHTVWLTNEFSLGFRLDLVQRFGLGGVTIASARKDDALPPVWDTMRAFVQDGVVDLFEPYGPYLVPCWQASDGTIDGYGAGCWKAGMEGGGSATWHAPDQPGVYDVTLIVSDGTRFVGQQLAVKVAGETAPESRPTPTPTTIGGNG
jgi:hypothetical protein